MVSWLPLKLKEEDVAPTSVLQKALPYLYLLLYVLIFVVVNKFFALFIRASLMHGVSSIVYSFSVCQPVISIYLSTRWHCNAPLWWLGCLLWPTLVVGSCDHSLSVVCIFESIVAIFAVCCSWHDSREWNDRENHVDGPKKSHVILEPLMSVEFFSHALK